MANKTALIFGVTGLVGGECLNALLESPAYDKVIALARKPLSIQHSKLSTVVVDFDKLDKYKADIKADDVYCAIGTTIAKAGSQEAFRKVDYEYPLKVAEIALWNGAQKFILCSSIGADAGSLAFYTRVKGELEEALKALKFKSLIIFRPSILLGHRKEQRMGEAVGMFVAEKLPFLFAGPLKKYRGTPVDMLGRVMVKMGVAKNNGVKIIENNEIFEIAGEQ